MLPEVYVENATLKVEEDDMARITLKSRPITKANKSEVPEHPEKQKGFIVILLLLAILLVAMTPTGCVVLLTALAGV